MRQHAFGPLAPVSSLTLGGGGLGMVWGKTTFAECVRTVQDALAAGITLLDLAPSYGDGKAEEVVGAALEGQLPARVRVTSKIRLGDMAPEGIEAAVRGSIEASLARLRLSRIDLFLLHSDVVPDRAFIATRPADDGERMTPYATFVDHVRPLFERLVGEGVIGAWGLTGIGHPDTLIRLLGETVKPAAIQCIANLLNSAGGLQRFDGPSRAREIIAVARSNGVGVMGIRAVQAGALTSNIDRLVAPDHPVRLDFVRAARFRALCADLDVSPALLAHRYALSLDIDTLVLGVKNRRELAECVAAAEAGPLPADLIAYIDASVSGEVA